MNHFIINRLWAALLWGCALCYAMNRRSDIELSNDRRWQPAVAPMLLPLYLSLLLFCIIILKQTTILSVLPAIFFDILAQTSIYFAFLIILTPLLRRKISATACASLWLLPNLLYLCQQNFLRRNKPIWIIPVKEQWLKTAFLIWIGGAVTLLLWKSIEHLRFRKALKESSYPENDIQINKLWQGLEHQANIYKFSIPLLRCPGLSGPLSVGLSPKSTFVALPDTDYSPEELELILRHELIHIVRRDGQTKLFLLFCTAFCWFNPLMWTAMKRSAEDLELSCDQLVLEFSDEKDKKRYAELLLSSAADPRGFTTNLASSAEALRYRLKEVMNHKDRHGGGAVAGLLLAILILSSGNFAFRTEEGTAGELILGDILLNADSLNQLQLGKTDLQGYTTELTPSQCTDQQALSDYLCSLTVSRFIGNYDLNENGEFLEIFLPGEDHPCLFILGSRYLNVFHLGNLSTADQWLLLNPVDWDYIRSLTEEKKAEPVGIQIIPPDMNVIFGSDTQILQPLTARGRILEDSLEGVPKERFSHWAESPCYLDGFGVTWAQIEFPFEFAPEQIKVYAREEGSAERQELPVSEELRVPLLMESAEYTVDVLWQLNLDDGLNCIHMSYRFTVVPPK